MLEDLNEKTMQHLSKLLGFVQSKQYKNTDPLISISGQIKTAQKKTKPPSKFTNTNQNIPIRKKIKFRSEGNVTTHVKNFQLESEKLQWCGIGFTSDTIGLIQNHLKQIAVRQKPLEIRFWGIIRGRQQDYYIIQGIKQPYKNKDELTAGTQKNGQGINYYSYWVTNNLNSQKWIQLPLIQPAHIRTARQIKRIFTGNLQQQVHSFPEFPGKQKHYLKAQLCRLTHAMQLAPKGVYKVHDQNPKVIEYEQQVKVPDFSELSTLEGWVHKNQMILNLGRCSHFVDPKTPEEQIEAKMAELAEKDPEVERLKGLTEEKVPEQLGLGIESPWLVKVFGNPQIFTKDDANLVYGVVGLKNILWPGWTTIGYRNGYSNIYIGNGLKSLQPTLSIYQNPDLLVQPQQTAEYHEPNPKQLPKQQPPAEEVKPEDQ